MAGTEQMVAEWPLPATDEEEDRQFWEHTNAGRLAIQMCSDCGRLRHPPRPMCPWCRSTKREWKVLSGKGTVWSYVIPHPPLLPAFMPWAPYNVIIVELDEDPTIRLVGNLVTSADGEINEIDPHQIQIGEPVEAVFARMADDCSLVRWVRPG
jgi:uncharacterized OB-fold protein